MSKIKEILKEKDNVLVFDIDGVLALQEWGEYNHFDMTDEEWAVMSETKTNFYTEQYVSKKMQEYLKDKDMSKVYVITKSYTQNEIDSKIYFANEFYNIPKDHVFGVYKDSEKISVFLKIMEKHKDMPNHKIIMIEDTVSVLNDVRKMTNCATVHISSFIDL